MIGGGVELVAGGASQNIFSELHGLWNFIDCTIGVVMALCDKQWDGALNTITTSIRNM